MALSTSACGGENETKRYINRPMSLWKKLLWIAVTLLGLGSLAILAMSRGEQINALWIIVAGLCAFAISYRFYSKWLASKVLLLNDERATPALVQNDGKDRKSTRLNSSHSQISYAVFCLKKKNDVWLLH